MILKKKISSYNDGVIGVYREKDTLFNTDFNAKTNARTLNDYEHIIDLCFSEENKRQEDFLFANAMGKNLTMKVKTPLVNGIETNYKVILNNLVYDIINIDPDTKNQDLYIYLEGGRKLA